MNWKLLVVAFALLGSTRPAFADQEPNDASPRKPHFSDAGRVLVAGSIGGWWNSKTINRPANWSVDISPSVSYFFKDRIGLGVAPSIGKGNESDGFRVREIGIGVLGIFDIPLAQRVSWLILPRLGYSHYKRDSPPFDLQVLGQTGVAVLQSSTQQNIRLTMFVPVALHVSSSIVIGLGPYFTYDRLIGSPDSTYSETSPQLGSGNLSTISPFQPPYNYFHVGVSSYIGASF